MLYLFFQSAGSRNNVNVRAFVVRSPLLNITKDFMICLKADSVFQPTPADIIDISGYNQPPVAQGSIEYVMGDVSSSSQVGINYFILHQFFKFVIFRYYSVQQTNFVSKWE